MEELPELSGLSVRSLLQLDAGIVSELRRRGLVRTNNKPLGDIAEQIVRAARGGVLEPNSTKSHDVTDANSRMIQVKALSGWLAGRSGQFSAFRSFGFDTAVFLVFEAKTLELAFARELSASEVESVSQFSAHTNGHNVTLGRITNVGVDVTDEMRLAYGALDGFAEPHSRDI